MWPLLSVLCALIFASQKKIPLQSSVPVRLIEFQGLDVSIEVDRFYKEKGLVYLKDGFIAFKDDFIRDVTGMFPGISSQQIEHLIRDFYIIDSAQNSPSGWRIQKFVEVIYSSDRESMLNIGREQRTKSIRLFMHPGVILKNPLEIRFPCRMVGRTVFLERSIFDKVRQDLLNSRGSDAFISASPDRFNLNLYNGQITIAGYAFRDNFEFTIYDPAHHTLPSFDAQHYGQISFYPYYDFDRATMQKIREIKTAGMKARLNLISKNASKNPFLPIAHIIGDFHNLSFNNALIFLRSEAGLRNRVAPEDIQLRYIKIEGFSEDGSWERISKETKQKRFYKSMLELGGFESSF